MPAYKGMLSERELEDLVTFVKAMANLQQPDPLEAPEVVEGYHIASRLGCFGCHGPGGLGGVSNPASFKGYVPPWDGEDFAELVHNEDELRQWILEGKINRLEANPLATYFTHNQVIQMPPYRAILQEDELAKIIAYIQWLRSERKTVTTNFVDTTVPTFSQVERGKWLYRQTGCVVCHGPQGEGDIPNLNAAGGVVPALNDVAEKMELFEKEDVEATVAVIERGLSLDDPSISPPVPYFDSVRSQYLKIRDLILKGGHPKKRDKEGLAPPMHMPAWSQRLYADGGPSSKADINAIIAYLLTLQTVEEDEQGL
jgi:mono/diheme cytochrome c family protein